MTGHVHSGFRHDLVVTYRTSWLGHALAIVFGAVLAAVVVGIGF